jgi:RNA polymerase sigma-70 factor, ECF subfamily
MPERGLHERTAGRLPAQRVSPVSGTVLTPAQQQSGLHRSPQVPDAALVRHALAGEQEAFELLVRRYQPALNSLISAYVREYRDADDILQQVLFQLYLSLARLHAEPSIYPWLYRVTCNQCLDHLRRQQPITFAELGWEDEEDEQSPLLSLRDPGPLPEELAERHEAQLHLRAAVAALPARYRPVVSLRSFAGLSFREIAQVLGVPESTAKTRFHRAKRLLRAALSAEVWN